MTKDEAMKKALTVLNVAAAYAEHQQMAEFFEEEAKDLCQAIEQAEKQEPYAYIYETNGPFGVHQSLRHKQYNGRYPDKTIPVYTAPPKREWQGLTDEEIVKASIGNVEGEHMLPHSFARAIEKLLREKNHD